MGEQSEPPPVELRPDPRMMDELTPDPFDHWAWWLLPAALVVLCVALLLTA